MDQLIVENVFPVQIYSLYKPEFLETVRTVSNRFLDRRKNETELNEAFPCYMTENVNYEPEMQEFANFVAQTGWNILDAQGYDVSNATTYFTEMWCQEHHRGSVMEQHTHGNGNQIVGFYFLDVPTKNAPKAVFYDPKPAKVQINLGEKDINNLTPASCMAHYELAEGMMMFAPAWLPHSFTRSLTDQPVKFIHFNINVKERSANCCIPTAEVI